MDAEEDIILRRLELLQPPNDNKFIPLLALKGALISGLVGLSMAFVATTVAGVEWPLQLVIIPQIALSFAILGGWVTASFMLDSRDDAAPQAFILTRRTPPHQLINSARLFAHGDQILQK